jgi:hypothetical protein
LLCLSSLLGKEYCCHQTGKQGQRQPSHA